MIDIDVLKGSYIWAQSPRAPSKEYQSGHGHTYSVEDISAAMDAVNAHDHNITILQQELDKLRHVILAMAEIMAMVEREAPELLERWRQFNAGMDVLSGK
jgi:hypothetical protein